MRIQLSLHSSPIVMQELIHLVISEIYGTYYHLSFFRPICLTLLLDMEAVEQVDYLLRIQLGRGPTPLGLRNRLRVINRFFLYNNLNTFMEYTFSTGS